MRDERVAGAAGAVEELSRRCRSSDAPVELAPQGTMARWRHAGGPGPATSSTPTGAAGPTLTGDPS